MNYIKTKEFSMKILTEKVLRNGEIVTRWFYVYFDSETGKKRKRICKDCYTEKEAKLYVARLVFLNNNQYLIKNIAAEMYLPESEHLKRLESFGRHISEETRSQKRQHIELIIQKWGERSINDLRVSEIEQYLLLDNHSGSWKNFYLETFGNIYDETIWCCDKPVLKPQFQRFARNSRQSDIFSAEELNKIFDLKLWNDYQEYLLFYITATCGLRLGEARGLKVNQFNFKEQYLLVNGFCKKNGFRTNYNKKGNENEKKYRVVPLTDECVLKVSNYIFQRHLDSDDFLFTFSDKPISQDRLYRTFTGIVKNLNLNPDSTRKLVPHSLRFTYVTRMRTELPVEDVRQLVGHNSTDMTEYYTRPTLSELKPLIEKSKNVSNDVFKVLKN